MGCNCSSEDPRVLRTTLLKTQHDSLNHIIAEAEVSLQELANVCNPLEVAIDRFFAVCGRDVDEGFSECLLALVLALLSHIKSGDFVMSSEPQGMKIRPAGLPEPLLVQFDSWCLLAGELQYTLKDLTDKTVTLMDCAATSHQLNLALTQLINSDDLRVVDIRKAVVVLEKNEEIIRSAAELLHLNVRRAKQYSAQTGLVLQWLRDPVGLAAAQQTANSIGCLGSAQDVLQLRGLEVQRLARSLGV